MEDEYTAERRAHLRAAIDLYLGRFPLAGDTSEGIVASWLPERGFEDAPLYIDDVIDAMVAAGDLRARRLPDGQIFYVGRAASTNEG